MNEPNVLIASASYLIRQGLMQLLKLINIQLDIMEADSTDQLNIHLMETKPCILLVEPLLLNDVHQFLHDRLQHKLPVIAGIFPKKNDPNKKYFDHCLCLYDHKKVLIKKLQELTDIKKEINGIHSSELSEREIAILKNVALGYTNKEISDQLHISPHTVITHRKNITAKLGIKTISGLTVYALINNLINPQDVNMG